MKWKNREFPFFGYHKSELEVYRFVEKKGQWFQADLKIYIGSYPGPLEHSNPYTFDGEEKSEASIASKFIEIDKLEKDKKHILIKNILYLKD